MNTTDSADREHERSDVPGPPGKRRSGRRLLRWGEHCLAAGVLIGLAVFVSPIPKWIYSAFDCPEEMRPAEYIICLGGGYARVIEGVRLLEEGYAEKMVVSNMGAAAETMRDVAIEWGAPADRIIIDRESSRTADHPDAVARNAGIDPANDECIIVTSYTHLRRAQAVFAKAGYRHIIMREVRWDRQARLEQDAKFGLGRRLTLAPQMLYACAAWVEYWVMGYI